MKALLVVVFLCSSQSSHAQNATAFERAKTAEESMDFETAVAQYQIALKGPGSRSERIETWKGLGMAMATIGDVAGAKKSFERWLLLEPTASLPDRLGPKFQKPFRQAKKAVGEKRNRLTIERGLNGEVIAILSEDVTWAATYQLNARVKGGEWQQRDVKSLGQPKLMFDPKFDVEAWAVAKDEAGGELYLEGAESSPLFFSGNGEPELLPQGPPVFQPKPIEATARVSEKPAAPWWPWVVGAAGVAVGATVGILLIKPQPLMLPPAQNQVRMP